MTDSDTTQKKLQFEGKSYALDSLSKETKDLVRGLQVADTQIKMHQDTLKLIVVGRQTMANQLKDKLKSEESNEIKV
tara:strand:- start:18858 stop:19088 length:231 start_codon:yes stop_codon:yes gene_type:complete